MTIYINGVSIDGGSVPGTPAEVLLDPSAPDTLVALDSSGIGTARTYAAVRQSLGLSPRAVSSPTPLLWYKCDSRDIAATTISNAGSVAAADAALVTATAGAEGPWGATSVQIGGGGYVLAPVDVARPTAAITICLWFRQNALANARLLMRSYDPAVWGPPFTSAYLYIDASGVLSGAINGAGIERGVATTLVARAGEWHHAALTFDGTTLRLYLDGVLSGTAAYAGTIDYGATPALTRWCLGGNNLAAESIVGEVCDARVLGVVLSASEVAALAGLWP